MRTFVTRAWIALWLAGSSLLGQTLLQDGVLLNTDNETLFAFTPQNSVVKLRITDGSVVWENKTVDQPLGLVDGTLVVLRDGLRTKGHPVLVFLNPVDGKETARPQASLPLASGAWLGVNDDMEKSLSVRLASMDEGFQLWWESEKVDISPVLRGHTQSRVQNTLSGAFIYDWAAQSLSPAPNAGQAPALALPQLVRNAQSLQGVSGRVFSANDGQHLMVPKQVGEATDRFRYRWDVYAQDGTLLGNIPNDTTLASYIVKGDLVIHIAQPYLFYNGDAYQEDALRLRAVNLKTQELVWQMNIRDTKYRGPLPP